jgi:hypothetical protein
LNTIGREPKYPYPELEAKLRQLREGEKLALKVIAQRLGYSVDHLRKLCVRFRIRVRTTKQSIAALNESPS